MVSNVTAAASLLKGVPRQWRGMYNAGGASTNTKSPFIIWTFCICFTIHSTRLRRTPLERGLAVAARLYLPKNTKQDYKRHGGSVETANADLNVTAAASPFERGATAVAGPLAEPAQIPKVLLLYGLSAFVLRYIPPGFAVPLSRGDSRKQSVYL